MFGRSVVRVGVEGGVLVEKSRLFFWARVVAGMDWGIDCVKWASGKMR